MLLLALGIMMAFGSTPARGRTQTPAGRGPDGAAAASERPIPEALNFANGLFRDRRWEMAAEEYERFLKGTKPGPDADDARFGLANARLFQGRYDQARKNFEEFLKAAPPNHPNAATALYRIGEAAYMLGDVGGARQALEKFTADNPGHRHLETAWPYLGDTCLRQSDLPAARKAYEQALTDPKGRLADRARFGLGRTLALLGEGEAARKVLQTLVEQGNPDWLDRAWLLIGQTLSDSGQYDRAVGAFQTLEKVAPKSLLVPEARLNRARALLQLNRPNEAEPVLRALAAEAPTGLAAQAAFELGTAQLGRGKAAEALATVDAALRRAPQTPLTAALLFQSAEAMLKLSQAETDPAARARRISEARTQFLKAADSDPEDPWADDALLRAARLALDGRDTEAARRLSSGFAARFPKSPLRADAHLIEARAALSAGQAKEAIARLTASLDEDKPSPETAQTERYYLGLAYRADGQTAKEAEVFEALAKTPGTPFATDAQYMLGQIYIETKEYTKAIAPLEKYLVDRPNGEVADFALAHLAQARLELGDSEGAEQALAQIASRFPKSKALAPTRLRLGEAALAARRYDRAAELLRLVATAEGKDVDPALSLRARSGLGWALLEGGHPTEAADAFAALLATAPDDPRAPDAALGRAHALELAKKTAEALAAYALVSSRYPRTSQADDAALARARLLVMARRADEAAKVYAQFVEAHPGARTLAGGVGLDTVLSEWGWALIDADKAGEADRVFSRLLNEFPDSPHAADARFNLAESAYQARDFDRVVTLLTPLVEAPKVPPPPKLLQAALYRLGRTQAERKEWSSAARTLDRLITQYPDNPYQREARFWRAEVAFQSDDLKTAERGFAALGSEPPARSDAEGFGPNVRRRRIQCLVGLKRWEDAIAAAQAYRKEAPKDPQLAEVDFALGRALQGVARFDEARAAFQAVIDARKGSELAALAQWSLGETFFHQRNHRQAIREFLKVDYFYPDAPVWQAAALFEAGKAYEQLDQWLDAAEMYEKLRLKFPKDPKAKEAEPLLTNVRKRLASQPDAARTVGAAAKP
jgi:TolA-binding protein